MKTSLLFSSYPFINSEKVTLTRITDMDLEALWQILGDEESHRFTAEGPLDSHRECARRLRRFDTMFQDQRGVVLGIYSTLNQLVGLMKISNINPEVGAVNSAFWAVCGFNAATFAVGEVAACYVLGTVLLLALPKVRYFRTMIPERRLAHF